MKKTELVAAIAERSELTKKEAEKTIKVFLGNEEHFQGNDTCIYKIQMQGKKAIVYQYMSYCTGNYFGYLAEDTQMNNIQEIEWDDVPVCIRKDYIEAVCPNLDCFNVNLLVYGNEEGNRINEVIKENTRWANEHHVFSESITLSLRKRIGDYDKVEELCPYNIYVDGYSFAYNQYLIDGQWFVTVDCQDKTYRLQSYAEVLKEKKEFGRKAAKLAKEKGISWRDAVVSLRKEMA